MAVCTSHTNITHRLPVRTMMVYQVITSYRWTRVSDSIWAITADEQPKVVWQKLKRYIDPDDYLVMLTFKSSSWSLKDQKVLAWLLERPAD